MGVVGEGVVVGFPSSLALFADDRARLVVEMEVEGVREVRVLAPVAGLGQGDGDRGAGDPLWLLLAGD